MAEWNLTRPSQGEHVKAAHVESALRAGETALNNLEDSAVEYRSLASHHLPTIAVAYGQEATNHGSSSPLTVSTAYPGWDQNSGWQYDGITATEVTLKDPATDIATSVNLTLSTIQGLEIGVNVNVKEIALAGNNSHTRLLVVGVDVYDGSAWVHVPKSERWGVSQPNAGSGTSVAWLDIPLRLLVTTADVGNITISKFRVGLAKAAWDSASAEDSEVVSVSAWAAAYKAGAL